MIDLLGCGADDIYIVNVRQYDYLTPRELPVNQREEVGSKREICQAKNRCHGALVELDEERCAHWDAPKPRSHKVREISESQQVYLNLRDSLEGDELGQHFKSVLILGYVTSHEVQLITAVEKEGANDVGWREFYSTEFLIEEEAGKIVIVSPNQTLGNAKLLPKSENGVLYDFLARWKKGDHVCIEKIE